MSLLNLGNRLLKPTWMQWAACAGTHPDVDFFSAKKEDIEKAKAMCGECAVEDLCLAYALDEDIRDGVWGGRDEKERRALQRGQ